MVDWSLILDGPAAGAFNMALDEALLESVAAAARGPTVRFYQWKPAAISLGVFQSYAEYEAVEPARRAPDVVRRVTGGGAILHDREWTYSLVLPRAHGLAVGDPSGLYRSVHRGLIAGLGRLGVACRLRGEGGDRRLETGDRRKTGSVIGDRLFSLPSGLRPQASSLNSPAAGLPYPASNCCADFFCFNRGDAGDVVTPDGRKIIGSAARRLPEAVLQHGSIVLSAPLGSTHATSAAEQLGREPDEAAVLESCRVELARALEVQWRVERPTAAELARAAELVRIKHAHENWLRLR